MKEVVCANGTGHGSEPVPVSLAVGGDGEEKECAWQCWELRAGVQCLLNISDGGLSHNPSPHSIVWSPLCK